MLERLAALDIAVFKAVHQTLWGTPWMSLLVAVQYAGEALGMVALFVFVVLIAPIGRRTELVLRLFVPVVLASFLCEVLKRLADVERPRSLIPALVLNASNDLP